MFAPRLEARLVVGVLIKTWDKLVVTAPSNISVIPTIWCILRGVLLTTHSRKATNSGVMAHIADGIPTFKLALSEKTNVVVINTRMAA